eukprot:TRINITY_DN19347_c0_g1_i2.p2 TRINITY_DN19347_c0_g1~~TRINITY_DN19347_c0_g1_i2.p2  ORF type:complete len:101 (+),score=25.50 TRINITY_DN19347_c0_g1_i2:52-354(+)
MCIRDRVSTQSTGDFRSSSMQALFAVLGLAPGCSKAEIRRAYRALALRLHPDRNNGVHSERFLRVQHCLLYTSDAADEEDSVDLGGRRIIKKKKKKEQRE